MTGPATGPAIRRRRRPGPAPRWAKPRPAGDGEGDGDGRDKAASVVAQVIGSTSFLGALLIYMGWNYDRSYLEAFSIPSPTGIGLSTVSLGLNGLSPLFSSNAAFFGAVLVTIVLVGARASGGIGARASGRAGGRAGGGWRDKVSQLPWPPGRPLAFGAVLTVVILALTWPNVSSGNFGGWFASHVDGVYLVLGLLAAGQLLMAWPARHSRAGQFAYPLALLVVALVTLWAGGVYAGTLGFQDALKVQAMVPELTAVTVYSAGSLDLSGPDVTCVRAQSGLGYPYRCTGLRLLWLQTGTYYLLPEGWSPADQRTYILDDSDQIRVELSPG
jgi:hypothetical protein